jgi:hypothetical protein
MVMKDWADFLGAHNPLIRRYFLGVFRFAKMALAESRTRLPLNKNKFLYKARL